ncbi:MAG TPA: MaoC family dehydratase [Solirubrobacteraceae bacterium]|nr:MaoC family dehydratase [Solirubrobacteraceae bacterium]
MAISASIPKAVADGIDGLRGLQDQVVGPSAWREVTQEMVDRFAEVSGDHQWIHVDVERAKRESPFGGPIAHGNLTLSMIDGMRGELNEWSGFALAVNYGWNKVRFPAPVPVGSRLHAYAQIVELTDVGGGWHQLVTRFTVEAEGGEKPVCVADSVVRVLAASA